MLRLRSVYKNVQRRFASTGNDDTIFELKTYFRRNRPAVNKSTTKLIKAMNSDLYEDDDDDYEDMMQKAELGIRGELAQPAFDYLKVLRGTRYNRKFEGSNFTRI